MKKTLVALLAAATVGGAFAQSSFPDVPENHWAGGAVDRIADLGIVIGFPDGTFRGNEAFTRYQSALVVNRLLDVISQELDARQALTDADLAALANALQDLAATVDAHDDAIASIGDDVAVNNARLDAIEALLASGDAAQIQDLLNQLEAIRLAADTAAAQAASASDLANNALGAANAAASRAQQNADALEALSWFASDLENRVKALEDGGTDASLAGDIANIREFVILIRRDQVAMRGQIAGLEEQVGTNTTDIADLQERVGALEASSVDFGGSISVNYRIDRTHGGPDFDVDRAYGVGLGRTLPGGSSVFSTGEGTRNNTPVEDERVAEHRRDVGSEFNEGLNASLELNVAFGRSFDGAGSPNALNNFEAVAVVTMEHADVQDHAGDDIDDAYVFAVDEFTGTFSPIGGAPLTFAFGEEISVNFTPYVFNQEEVPGFVATLENPAPFLDFLDPTLTAAYVTPDGDTLDEVYRGARLTVSPFDGVAIGASFAQHAVGTHDKDDSDANNVETTVWGVDASAAISIFSLQAEFATSSTHAVATGTDTDNGNVLYVIAGVDTADIPVLNSLSANYRSIDENWYVENVNDDGLNDDDDYFVFEQDQTGFGVDASLSLWVVDLEAYFNSYTTSVLANGSTDAAGVLAFGVDLSAEIFRAISVTGFFHSASVDGSLADSTRRPYDDADGLLTVADGNGEAVRVDRDGNLNTGFGIGLAHDGSADNALVPNLNVSAVYSQTEADFGRSVIDVDADYALSLGFLSASPYVGFYSANSDNNAGRYYDAFNVSEITAGIGLETEEFDFFLRPSLSAAVNYRSASYTDNHDADKGAADFDASEFQFSVGLVLNEFILDHSTLTVRYGSWAGTNVNAARGVTSPANRVGNHSQVSQIHDGDVAGTGDQMVNGYEAVWDYYDLQFAYGVYVSNDGRSSAAQVFSVSYTVDF